MRRLFDSVRVRLTATVTLVFGIALSLAAVGMVRQVESTLVNDLRSRNDTVAAALGDVIRATGNPVTITDSQLITSRGVTPEDAAILQQGLNESLVYVQGPGSVGMSQAPSLFDRLRRAVTGEAIPLFGKTLPARVDQEQYAVSQVAVAAPNGDIVLSVASSLDPIRRTVDRVSGLLLFAVPSLVFLVGAAAWMMTGRTLRPVSAITGRVQEITSSTLDQRVPVPRIDDEIGQLARTMNAMLDRLESAAANQKRFISDASHELRSPVAAIRAQLEIALLHPESADWDEVGRTVLAEDERLARLVDNLLALARLEEGSSKPSSEVDLDELVHELLARDFRVPVDRSGVVAGRVWGVQDELVSVIRNLVDNAERHATSKVRVSLATEGTIARLTVEDDGPGVPPDQRAKVFERFARLEEGRSRDAGGAGIGLALTKRVAESHGGRVWIQDSPLGGASFLVELPALGADDDGSAD